MDEPNVDVEEKPARRLVVAGYGARGFRTWAADCAARNAETLAAFKSLGRAADRAGDAARNFAFAIDAAEDVRRCAVFPVKKQAAEITNFNYYRHFEKKPRNRNKRVG